MGQVRVSSGATDLSLQAGRRQALYENSKELSPWQPSPESRGECQGRQPPATSPADRPGIDPACAPLLVQLMAWKKLASCSPAVT